MGLRPVARAPNREISRLGTPGDWPAMTNLSKADRARLAERFVIAAGSVVACQTSSDGVHKLLIAWDRSPGSSQDTSEAVMIPSDDAGGSRRTACVSTQVGCPVGCRFCASGLGGLGQGPQSRKTAIGGPRNLTAGQIVEQVWQLARVTLGEDAAGKQRITNLVLMGTGEPLANYDAVVKAIRLANASDGLDIGARKITLSTIGLPAQIRRLAGEGLQITLAISLHAPNQALRAELIPWADRFPLDAVLAAARDYFARTGREITLEYLLLDGINTLPEHADQLADIAHSLRCNVNLIGYNPVAELPFKRAGQREAAAFRDRLTRRGVNAHIRTSRGLTIDAACGQLRRRGLGQGD